MKPLAEGRFRLEKFPGKGGWTYVALPFVKNDPASPFGWIRVSGCIDSETLTQYHLMPMGNGHLFLPVKKEIRKKIKKEAGQEVSICLYRDDSPLILPDELMACLKDEPHAFEKFMALPDTRKKSWIDSIQKVKSPEKKAEKILRLMGDL